MLFRSGDAPSTLNATATSGLPVSFATVQQGWNIQFGCTATGSCFTNNGGSSPLQTGAGVVGRAGDVWNRVTGVSNVGQTGTNIALTDVSGNSSPVTVSWTSAGFYYTGSTPSAFSSTPYANVMSGYLISDATPRTVTISNLTPNASYQLYVLSQGDASTAGRRGTFSVNGGTSVTTAAATNTGTFISGQNYVLFNSAADGTGTLTLTYVR